MPLKKSELYSSLWASCDELRGGMDASQYKDYVLVLLFMKYVSDKAASQKGYLLDVPKGGSFADMVALKGDKEIGDKINSSWPSSRGSSLARTAPKAMTFLATPTNISCAISPLSRARARGSST